MLHQIPFKASIDVDSTMASGILSALSSTPVIDGCNVLPNPWNAPAEAISVHMKSWDSPRILK